MSRIRIVCKAPPQPAPRNPLEFPKVNLLPTFEECMITAVDDDGRELVLDCVTYARFEVWPNGEPARVVLTIENVEIDALGQLDTAPPDREGNEV